jgi:hypothetical protein
MADNRIEALIKQVQALQVQVYYLTEQQQLHQQDTVPVLAHPSNSDQAPIQPKTFPYPGDRICILNTVKRPQNWDTNTKWDPSAAKLATITSIEYNRIYFTTDNGVTTAWRLLKNIRQIPNIKSQK